MQQKISELISSSQQLLDKLEKEQKSLSGTTDKADRLKKLEASLKLLKTDSGAYPQHMLADQISYLYTAFNDADQRPGDDVVKRYAELSAQLNVVKKMLD